MSRVQHHYPGAQIVTRGGAEGVVVVSSQAYQKTSKTQNTRSKMLIQNLWEIQAG